MAQSPPTQYGLALLLGLIAAAVVYVLRSHGIGDPSEGRSAPPTTEPADAGFPSDASADR